LIACAAGALLLAGVGATAATAATATTTTTSTTPAGSTTTTTLPPLPVPQDAPADNEPEPQTFYGRIQIPSIEVDSPLLEGIRINTLDYGPGHWPGTAMPGELGNVVVAGHRVSMNEDFRDIDQLAPGDDVIFTTDSGRHVYRVESTEIVSPDALWVVDQTYAKTATLFACHPPGSVAQRIVVHLELA
jgi:sortase A